MEYVLKLNPFVVRHYWGYWQNSRAPENWMAAMCPCELPDCGSYIEVMQENALVHKKHTKVKYSRDKAVSATYSQKKILHTISKLLGTIA